MWREDENGGRHIRFMATQRYHHRQIDEDSEAIIQPTNGFINGNHSSRGSSPPKIWKTSKPSNSIIVVIRIIFVALIIVCTTWGFLIIKIATDINTPADESQLRPRFHKTKSPGWIIEQKVNLVEMQLRQVPLLDVAHMDSPVLIITCKRANYLDRTLWNIFESHPAQQFVSTTKLRYTRTNKAGRIMGSPIIVSVDGSDPDIQSVIESYRQLFELRLGIPLYQLQHSPSAQYAKKKVYNPRVDWADPYKLIAQHLGWAIEQTFSGKYSTDPKHYRRIPTPPLPQRVIILEEDIEIAKDFFSLMNATADLLDLDDTLLAISGFNDNGNEQIVSDRKRLVRSDFFPGLGWMMSRNVWDGPESHPGTGLKNNWAPNGFWDDWLRESNIRRGRQVIRPEVSRSFHFGNVDGASAGNEIAQSLHKIKLEGDAVHWESLDLSYLHASSFAESYWNRVSHAKLVKNVDEAKRYVADGDVRLIYTSFDEFSKLALHYDIMKDEKAGVPRTAYEGLVEIRYGRGHYFIFLTPPYVNGQSPPLHFGLKAWMEISKESLMHDLGIHKSHYEAKPALKTIPALKSIAKYP